MLIQSHHWAFILFHFICIFSILLYSCNDFLSFTRLLSFAYSVKIMGMKENRKLNLFDFVTSYAFREWTEFYDANDFWIESFLLRENFSHFFFRFFNFSPRANINNEDYAQQWVLLRSLITFYAVLLWEEIIKKNFRCLQWKKKKKLIISDIKKSFFSP